MGHRPDIPTVEPYRWNGAMAHRAIGVGKYSSLQKFLHHKEEQNKRLAAASTLLIRAETFANIGMTGIATRCEETLSE